jgi:hypothetical protein
MDAKGKRIAEMNGRNGRQNGRDESRKDESKGKVGR